ncbi:MAG TPA: cellulase family glycosylhydrolase [Parafilimonas sp.]|nr:cellulase family glycosylhydrolase [Parafilimonas sp.]
MKKLACLSFFLFIIIFTVQAQGFLKASGKQIVNEKNENVLLRGIGLGGWMLQEGYMLRLNGTNPQYSIRNRIEKLISPEQTQEFYDTWLDNFITKADIDSLHTWGFNSVRLPMHYNLFTLPAEQEPDPGKQTWLKKGFQLTDSLLSWCKVNHMYLILDLHAAPGGQGNDLNIADRDSTKPSLWQSEANKTKTIELWRTLAERYKDEPNIAAYDILNEPNRGFDDTLNDKHGQKETHNQPLKELYVNITNAIRSVDKKHIIIIEGNAWGNNYKGILPTWDNNMVLSFHKYWNSNDIQSIQYILDTRNQYNVPVWLGETGENSNTWFTDAVHLFESNNIGWSWWPLKKPGNNNPLQIKMNHNYQHLADYWNGKDAEPPKESDVYSGLMEFAIYTNIRSNIVHHDVIDALIRQPFSNKTLAFQPNSISTKDSIIHAVDYDLGRNNFAYFDKDTGNYYLSFGGRNAGNKGYTYRNDGVDIYKDSARYETYYVGSIEDSEWIQYTIDVRATASYNFKLTVAAETAAKVSVIIDGKTAFDKKDITATGSLKSWQTQNMGSIGLSQGRHTIRIYVNKGGFNLKDILLVKR